MATVQPNTGVRTLPPTQVPAPLPQLQPAVRGTTSAGFNAVDPANAQGATGDPNLTMTNGVAIGTVNPNELAGTQLAGLQSSSSPLVQLALANGAANAAATGNANGTLMAGASENALLNQLTPIAQQQAEAYQRQQAQNEDAINQLQNTRTSVHGQIAAAGISANASMHNAQLQADIQKQTLQQNAQQFTQNWANQFQMATQSQNFQKASQEAQNEFQLKGSALSNAMNTIFSDPSYWADPQSSMGMLNYFTTNIGSLIDSLGIGTGTPQPNPNIPSAAP